MPKVKLVLNQSELDSLKFKLRERFKILNILEEEGVHWAKCAINPEDNVGWTHDEYLSCYNNPEA